MLSSGESCLGTILPQSGIMEAVLLIDPKETNGTGFLFGKMGSVISMNVSKQEVGTSRGGLELISSSKCHMKSTILEKVGKVAAENSHKWVFRDAPDDGDPTFISSWNASTEPQPRAWEFQFQSGIQTIAIISVREGIIQLGSFDKILEDLNLVISIQRKLSYLQSIPGVFAMQRPYLPIQHPYILKPNPQMIANHDQTALSVYEKRQLTGAKRLFNEVPDDSQTKSINLGWNTPQNGLPGSPPSPILPLLPSISCSLGALLSKLPSVNIPCYNSGEAPDREMLMNNMSNSGNNCADQMLKVSGGITKIESSCHSDVANGEKHSSINPNLGLENEG
ncbi:uncharacterized protein LOC103950522 isoform X3 [Pyrus x bretschneideri]|uniref:uncharacterized protein LOC103950522 isoform X3 n=1 Tax=Pyrus x bretschneideri TaxID=225117 RepID=UPI00202E6559|nr:uncharacterized protein LOC103950522 isoform X3 [Pyrus x bretschneideri]